MNPDTTALPPETVEQVVRAAGRAPSVHNTQPWRFTVVGDVVDVHADRSRQLAVLDPAGRQLHLSCGAALGHARISARALGIDADVTLLPDATDADHLARMILRPGAPATPEQRALADAILLRSTHRGRFGSTRVPLALLEQLRVTVDAEGAGLRSVVGPDDLVELTVLLAHADAEENRDPRYREELQRWADLPGAPDVGIGSGVLDPTFVAGSSLSLRQFSAAPPDQTDDPPLPDHPDVVVLVTRGDQPGDWLIAGQALGALLLTAASHGVLAQPLGQVTDTPGYRHRLAVSLGLSGVPQLALRLGFPEQTGTRTGRRRLGEVLDRPLPGRGENVGA